MITYLLEDAKCDPNIPTSDGETPLDIATSPEIIRLLLKKGARPDYSSMNKCFPKQLQRDPDDMTVKVFVLGNPGAGKSTIIKSIETVPAGFGSRLVHRLTKVRNIDEKTAGIIPYDIVIRGLGRVTIFDFAGHREFYAGHDALLRNSMTDSPSIIMLVVDMSLGEQKMKEEVRYWLEFLAQQNYNEASGLKPHLLLIGSHIDKIPASDVKSSAASFHNLNTANFVYVGQVMLDCRYAHSPSMSDLRAKLSHSCQMLRDTERLEFIHHCVMVFLLDKFRHQPAVTLREVSHALNKAAKSDHEFHWRFMKSVDLLKSCEQLNKQGSILLMKNHECLDDSWVVLDKTILLSQVNGVVFAPKDFKQHQKIATNTGVVPLSKLITLFPKLDSDMISQFLCHLEFCQEITDVDVLALLQSDDVMSCTSERFFFFPALVHLDTPLDLWQNNADFNYHTGWILKCLVPEQFFSPRFLQVLLLRLAFSFALAPSNPDVTTPPLQRKCSVWKNGISWANRSGGEAIVEVLDQKQVVVMTRSKDEKLESVHLRSLIVQTVLATRGEFCHAVLVQESLIPTKDAIAYPINLAQVKDVCITDIAQTVVEGKKFVVIENREMLRLDELLHFEPYANFEERILQEIFHDHDPQHHQEITVELIYRIAERAYKNIDDYVALFMPSPLRLANSVMPPGDVHRLAQIIRLWKEEMGAKGTRCGLHCKLDQYSVFAGRNPLNVAEGNLINTQ